MTENIIEVFYGSDKVISARDKIKKYPSFAITREDGNGVFILSQTKEGFKIVLKQNEEEKKSSVRYTATHNEPFFNELYIFTKLDILDVLINNPKIKNEFLRENAYLEKSKKLPLPLEKGKTNIVIADENDVKNQIKISFDKLNHLNVIDEKVKPFKINIDVPNKKEVEFNFTADSPYCNFFASIKFFMRSLLLNKNTKRLTKNAFNKKFGIKKEIVNE